MTQKNEKSVFELLGLSTCRVLITGAQGFIGKNLLVRLSELTGYQLSTFLRNDDTSRLTELVRDADIVVHLAGENRPQDEMAFTKNNVELTEKLCNAIRQRWSNSGNGIPVIMASSTQVELDTPYGQSKLKAERLLQDLEVETGNPATIFRLPGIFGKWCKPNYNSVVATFCHNIARNQPIHINDPQSKLRLVYIDDVISAFIKTITTPRRGVSWGSVVPEYTITLKQLADQIRAFGNCRSVLVSERVGSGLTRALYATYISYLPREKFVYDLTQHADQRGVFVEMLKTLDTGQFSYFTAFPGITRGSHYHHSKTEKFLVVKGVALFRFRQILTNELFELKVSSDKPQIVDTIPGWAHDITNIGNEEMVVMLWANENFDSDRPDTITSQV